MPCVFFPLALLSHSSKSTPSTCPEPLGKSPSWAKAAGSAKRCDGLEASHNSCQAPVEQSECGTARRCLTAQEELGREKTEFNGTGVPSVKQVVLHSSAGNSSWITLHNMPNFNCIPNTDLKPEVPQFWQGLAIDSRARHNNGHSSCVLSISNTEKKSPHTSIKLLLLRMGKEKRENGYVSF